MKTLHRTDVNLFIGNLKSKEQCHNSFEKGSVRPQRPFSEELLLSCIVLVHTFLPRLLSFGVLNNSRLLSQQLLNLHKG